MHRTTGLTGYIGPLTLRGAPDLDPDPAGYPVFFQDPDPTGYKNIRIRQNPDPAGYKQSGSGQPDSLPCSTNHCKHALCFITQCQTTNQ